MQIFIAYSEELLIPLINQRNLKMSVLCSPLYRNSMLWWFIFCEDVRVPSVCGTQSSIVKQTTEATQNEMTLCHFEGQVRVNHLCSCCHLLASCSSSIRQCLLGRQFMVTLPCPLVPRTIFSSSMCVKEFKWRHRCQAKMFTSVVLIPASRGVSLQVCISVRVYSCMHACVCVCVCDKECTHRRVPILLYLTFFFDFDNQTI